MSLTTRNYCLFEESAKLRALRAIVPYTPSNLGALVSRVSCPAFSRASRASCPTCSHASLTSYLTCSTVKHYEKQPLLKEC